MKLIKTGIAGLDEFLTGGLPPRILLLTGTPGSGNEIFAKQIAYTRAKQNPITYFTVNTSFDSIREDMNAYNWDITPLETNGNWKFKTLQKTNDLAQTITEEIKQKRTIILDSLSEVLFTRKTQEAIDLLTEMSHQNKNTENFHLLLLTEGMQDPNAETAMQHFAEGVINFNTTWTTDNTKRDILIRKLKGSFIPNRRLPYSITKKGFVIETATRIS
ncbi:MAG: RAD55 family ATPase [Candidatus Bathyarchaeota archaeon]|nr:RAD55 family ATPase [Candidatus Bathyarchaeota archaeon]